MSSETITVIRPDFTTNDQSQCLDVNSFAFTNTGATGATVSHSWTFGDGNSSTQENPTHTYAADGVFTVTHNVIFTATGCTATATSTATVFPEPTITASVDADVICSGGTEGAVSTSISGGTAGFGYVWSPGGQTTANISGLGVGTYNVVVTDANGCTDSASGTVDQVDPEDPTVTCPSTGNITTDAGLCTSSASIGTATSSDNCGITSTLVSNSGPYSVGTTTVTWTATDANGNTATCTQDVVVTDGENPTVTCPSTANITTDAGLCTSTASIGTATGTDNCGVPTTAVDNAGPYSVGTTTVTWTATDANGNTATFTQDVVVTDGQNPTAVCADITVQLDANGNASITAGEINNGSSDNCGVDGLSVDVSDFDCSAVGANTVTLTVTDVNGNTSTCTSTVTVEDNIDPTAVCADITVQLDANGNASITAAEINNGSSDNCGVDGLSVDVSDFDCSAVGANTVTLTVTDVNGNTSTCTSTVTVEDNIDPTAVCADITVQLDAQGVASITASEIDGGSSDNCGIDNISASTTSFDCDDEGVNTVTLTVTDVNGNVSTCDATVTVENNITPTVSCQDITVQLDANGTVSITSGDVDGGSNAACGIASLSVDPSAFDCTNVGPNTVTLTGTDNSGNVSTCDATVTVEDNIDPTAVCADITVQLDAQGTASITAGEINNGSSDNCGVDGLSVDVSDFDCSAVGANTVTLTVTDVNGNTSTCTSTVTVEDNIDPTAVCQDVQVQLSSQGTAFVNPSEMDNGSFDNCGITSLELSQVDFGCEDVGENLVTLTVTDVNGNTSTCTAEVNVDGEIVDVEIIPSGPTTFCEGNSITLTSSEAGTYLWNPNGESTQEITVTESGTYSVFVINQFGCSGESDPITITVLDVDSAIISTSGATEFCGGGQVTLSASNGDTFEWYPNGETTQSITVSESGDYTVFVTNPNGCGYASADTITVTVNPNPVPTITADGPTSFCDGESVTLTSSITDGNSWAPFGQTTQSIVVSTPGFYRVTVTDANGCQGTSNQEIITVFDTPEPEITADGPTEFCKNDSVILTSSNADDYLWAPNGETTQSITVFESGTYSVTVIDENGCEGEALTAVEVTVFEAQPASVTAIGSLEFCDGNEVVLTSSLGDGYLWSPNGETTQSITVTESGDYIVTVTDENGCDAIADTVEVTVFELPEPEVSLSGPAIFCEGDSVVLTATQSEAYLWSPNGETTQSITVFESGSYVVEVADVNTCVGSSDTIEIEVHEATEIEIIADGATEFCADDEVVLTATGGQSYEWSPNGEQTQSITVTESGEYVVSVTDANGCSYDSDTLDIEVFELPTVSIDVTGDIIFCEGETVGLTAVTPDVVTYEWLENGASINGADTELLTVGDSSLYTVIVTDANGCAASDDAPVMTVGAVPVAVVSEDQWMCAQGDVTLTVSGGDNYLWSNGETGSMITVSPDSAMYFTVTVTNQFCSFASSDSALVSLYPSPVAEIQTNPSGILEVNHDFTDVSGDSSIVYWEWNYGDGDFEEEQNPDHLYSEEGFFTVILTVENEFGCIDTDTADVEITQVIDIPNVFTPNDDGINDYIFIDNFGVDEYEFTVYNRWGLIMHYDSSTEISWDGRTPAGAEAKAGTYFYILKAVNPHSEGNLDETGTITLIR